FGRTHPRVLDCLHGDLWGPAAFLTATGNPGAARVAANVAASLLAADAPGRGSRQVAEAGYTEERTAQGHTFRDIFGNPFRPPPVIEPGLLSWNGGTVVSLAQATYQERNLPLGTMDGAYLAVLADALEEAGCSDSEILGHLRGPGPHVLGCWALGLVLGKE